MSNNQNTNRNNETSNVNPNATLGLTRPKIISLLQKEEIFNSIKNSSTLLDALSLIIVTSFILLYALSTDKGTATSGNASTTIWSMSIALFSFVCVLIIRNVLPKSSLLEEKGAAQTLPILFLIVGYLWYISMNIKYFKEINLGNVAPEYNGWSNLTVIFFIIMTSMILFTIKSDFNSILSLNKGIKNTVNNSLGIKEESFKITLLIIFIIFILYMLLGIQQVVLDKFSLQG